MPFIDTPAESELYAADEAAMGYLPNYTRLFGNRPEAYRAWRALNGAIKSTMELRRYELVTFAAARRLRSSYCALAHGKLLAEGWFAPDEVAALARDGHAALDEVDAAVMAFASASWTMRPRSRRPTSTGCARSASATTRSSTWPSPPRRAASSPRRSTPWGPSPTARTARCSAPSCATRSRSAGPWSGSRWRRWPTSTSWRWPCPR